MSKVYMIKGNETGYEYSMTFYDDVDESVEIDYFGHGIRSMLYGFSATIGDRYELDNFREDFTNDMLDGISQCGSLEEAKDLALIALEADYLFDYVFDNWGCPDCEY